MVYTDADGKTFLYILYLESLQLDPSAADYLGSEAAIFWYVGDGAQYHSSQSVVLTDEPVRYAYCSFFSITMPNLPDRSQNVTMTLSVNDDHIGVAFLDFKGFGENDVFKESTVQLLTDAGVLATAKLHTASQARWSFTSPIEPTAGFFVDHTVDDQAKQLHDHIFPQAEPGPQERSDAQAEQAAEIEARKREAEREERRKAEEDAQARREAERKEQEEKEKARRQEEERKRDEERAATAREDDFRRDRDRAEEDRRTRESERRARWEEEEAERRRAEVDRRKQDFERDDPPPFGDSRRKERQQWEEDRERLKRDARRLRERELADLERRAEDRRRQIEALTSSRLARGDFKDERVRESQARRGSHSGPALKGEGRTQHSARGRPFPKEPESEASDRELNFDGEEEEEAPHAHVNHTGAPAGAHSGFQWPRNHGPGHQPSTARTARAAPRPREAGGQHLVLRGGLQVGGSSAAAELSLAERLEHFRSQAQLNRLPHRDVVVDSSSGVLESIELSATKEGEGIEPSRSVNTTPRKKLGLRKGTEEGRKANAVLSAVLQDTGSFGVGGNVAQMEEAVLRLLVLHKELAGQDEAPKAALADATAGLAPRMLQVLQAAKAICEANRARLHAYTEEKQLGIDRSDYMVPQMRAIEKLHQQFSSLIPGRAEIPEMRCACGADFTVDAKFCRLCGRRRSDVEAPSSARWSPRPEPSFQHLHAPPAHFAPSLSSSPPSARRSNLGYIPSARLEARGDRPIDPGLPDSQLPALRGGSPVKPRTEHSVSGGPGGAGMPQTTPRSEVSSIAAPWSQPEYRVRRVNVPAIPHWDRRALGGATRGGAAAMEAESSAMWDAVAAATVTPARPVEVRPTEPVVDASPLWDAVATVACSARRSPRLQTAAPLRTAMQQVRGVADELSHPRRGRGNSGGGAHAGAGSPSPDHRQIAEPERPPEDKYLKILQSLQAKGAMNGGLAAQLLEKQGLQRGLRRGMQDTSDSESSEYVR